MSAKNIAPPVDARSLQERNRQNPRRRANRRCRLRFINGGLGVEYSATTRGKRTYPAHEHHMVRPVCPKAGGPKTVQLITVISCGKPRVPTICNAPNGTCATATGPWYFQSNRRSPAVRKRRSSWPGSTASPASIFLPRVPGIRPRNSCASSSASTASRF